ncbi:hypothetical protein CEXT_688541 [Caerostris extrusa]|uniref:Uncharacterized protein n=1 Tax=Caerostris extrusa TaxID=172846 RepID=A0AAV4QXA9_CAEEX|nr:hypothetical protein CEXT_688541 [Caerostris extrusa]
MTIVPSGWLQFAFTTFRMACRDGIPVVITEFPWESFFFRFVGCHPSFILLEVLFMDSESHFSGFVLLNLPKIQEQSPLPTLPTHPHLVHLLCLSARYKSFLLFPQAQWTSLTDGFYIPQAQHRLSSFISLLQENSRLGRVGKPLLDRISEHSPHPTGGSLIFFTALAIDPSGSAFLWSKSRF